MGWIMLVAGKSFFENMSIPVTVLVITGGSLYTLGVIFYLWENIPIAMLYGISLYLQRLFVIM
ncbi:MAG: hypothetical protein WDO19_12685 [Bacteroidota bacterium]